jgi:hypothetical protein
VGKAGDPAAQHFAFQVELYYAARFGGADVANAELERLARLVVRPPDPREKTAPRPPANIDPPHAAH